MTKVELIKKLQQEHPHIPPGDVDQAVREILAMISDSLAQEERVEIRDFGVFTTRYRQQRTARNPKTGEKVIAPPLTYVHFKAGLELRHRVDYAREEVASS